MSEGLDPWTARSTERQTCELHGILDRRRAAESIGLRLPIGGCELAFVSAAYLPAFMASSLLSSVVAFRTPMPTALSYCVRAE